MIKHNQMVTITQEQQAKKLLMDRLAWMGQNRGILSKVAREVGVSPGFVRIVFRGGSASSGGVVEGALAIYGAPGFSRGRKGGSK